MVEAALGKGLEAKHLQDLVKEQIEQPASPPGLGGSAKDAILRIPVTVQVILGSAKVPVAKVMEFAPGAVVTLDQKLGEPVTLIANGREIARGEIVVLDETTSQLGVNITEVSGGPR
jgi:flagellar motor switch protein FliN/FliY